MNFTGYTMVPNSLLDYGMREMSPSVFKIVMAIVRKTAGWGKESDIISLSQLEAISKLTRKTVIASIKDAIAQGWIEQTAVGNSFSYRLGVNAFACPKKQKKADQAQCHSESSAPVSSGVNTLGSGITSSKLVEPLHTQKTLPKETNTKDNCQVVDFKELPQTPQSSKQASLHTGRRQVPPLPSDVYLKIEKAITDKLGHEGVSLWQKIYAKHLIARFIAEGKSSINALIYSIAYALEKDGNPGIVFNMIKSAPAYVPAWSDELDLDTGKPEWRKHIWNAFGDSVDPEFVEEAPLIF